MCQPRREPPTLPLQAVGRCLCQLLYICSQSLLVCHSVILIFQFPQRIATACSVLLLSFVQIGKKRSLNNRLFNRGLHEIMVSWATGKYSGGEKMLTPTLVQEWKKSRSYGFSIPVHGEDVSIATSADVSTPISMLCDKPELTGIICQSNQCLFSMPFKIQSSLNGQVWE